MHGSRTPHTARRYRLKPLDAIAEAATLLDAAANAHLAGNRPRAAALIAEADIPAIADWTGALWGPGTSPGHRVSGRPASQALTTDVLARDACHCRFCGTPVLRAEIRVFLKRCYPLEVRWGPTNREQHAAFQAMGLVLDHIVPASRGGETTLDNLVATCAPCSSSRIDITLEESGLDHPIQPTYQAWDGLERLLHPSLATPLTCAAARLPARP